MEEIEQSLSPLVTRLLEVFRLIEAYALAAFSIPQLVGIFLTLALAFVSHRRIKAPIQRIESQTEAVFIRRILRTARSISLPIVWVVGLWILLSILGAFGQVNGLVRLVASLLNAWIVIRIASTLIPSAGLSSAFAWSAWSVAALNAVGFLDPFIRWMDSKRFANDAISISLWGVVQGLIVTAFLMWLAYAVSGFIQTRLEKTESLNPSMRVLTSKLLRIGFVVIAIVVGMQSVGIDLTAFAFFSGALGLGVGLGMQRTVSNLVAGFTMLADRSIKPGDVIEIETASGPTYGEVKTLNARYVSVKTRSGTETLIPNEILIANPVTNWSFTDKLVRRSIPVGVAYDTDVEQAQALCIEAALKCPRVLQQPPPVCLVRGFGDSSVDLELRFWLTDPESGVANIASEVNLHIWKLFKQHKIEIPFPQRDINIKSPEPHASS